MNSVKNTADRRMENGVSRRREGEERKGDERGRRQEGGGEKRR